MFDFSRVWLVAKREWFARLRQRSFQITTIIQLLIFVGAACIPTIVGIFMNDNDNDSVTVQVLDETGSSLVQSLTPYLAFDIEGQPAIEVNAATGSAQTVQTAVEDGDADAGLVISRDDAGLLGFAYYSKSGDSDILSQRVYSAAQSLNMQDRLAQVGVNQQEFEQAVTPPPFQLTSTSNDATDDESDAEQGARYAIAYVFAILAYMAVMLYGTWVAQGVVEEKSSRIMEIMINAATPRDLLFGKVLGIGMSAMTQMLPTIIIAGVVFSLQSRIADAFGVADNSITGIDFGALSLQSGGWFLIYFVLGFILYAALYAGVGSLVSRQEEVNQAIAPMTTVVMAGFFGAIYTLTAPDSIVAQVLSIVPFTSTTTMVPRIVLGDPQPWELALSLVLLFVTAILAILFAARIYRIGVLMYGQKPSIRTIFNPNVARVSR
jgi:ABC-2 type transport system permease protein